MKVSMGVLKQAHDNANANANAAMVAHERKFSKFVPSFIIYLLPMGWRCL